MQPTSEQQQVIDYVCSDNPDLTLVSSVAGSGKTTLLVHIAKCLAKPNGLYLAYNKSVATESRSKFPSSVSCVTTHALAYKSIVVPNKYKIGTFNFKSIKERLPYIDKCLLVDDIREFCLSKYTSFEEYAEATNRTQTTINLANNYLTLMEEGKIDMPHEVYLKLFHLHLASGELEFEPFGFIMLDEAGDINEVTLEIFKLLPSSIKIAVGDPYQNIYAFNHTINCFEVLKDSSKLFRMSTSFRVNRKIASQIQHFCQNTLDSDMQFVGVDTDDNITTRGYLTRTNAALIDKMIQLNKEAVPYSLVRSSKQIFELPVLLASLKYQGYVSNPAYNHLQKDVDNWYEDSSLRESYSTVLSYIANLYADDLQITSSIRLINKHTKKGIFDALAEAAKHERTNYDFTLATAHSVKGLEFDEVIIDQSLEDMVSRTIASIEEEYLTTDSRAYLDAMNLYYVACSRAKKSLIGANMLNRVPNLL